MGVSAISTVNNSYNLATKSQYENYPATDIIKTDSNYLNYIEEQPEKSKLGLATIALGIIGLASIGVAIGRHMKVKNLSQQLTEKTTALDNVTKKLAEAENKATTAEKALEKANATIEELKNPPKKPNWFKRKWQAFQEWRRNRN